MPRAWRWVAQALVLAAVAWFLWRAIGRQWEAMQAQPLALHPSAGWLALSCATVGATYLLQIESWRGILAAWGQRLDFAGAARIWFLANLGRYLPGKVWSVAGLVVLAEQRGVARWAAASSAVAVQAVGIATAAAAVALARPEGVPLAGLGVAALGSASVLGVLTSPALIGWAGRRVPLLREFRALPPATVAWSALLTLASWGGYGLVLWSLARGLLGPLPFGVGLATGAFALAYVAGLLALLAPGGLGVRETMLVGLLGPALGAGAAVAVSVASRLQLTITEAAAGGLGLLVPSPVPETVRDQR